MAKVKNNIFTAGLTGPLGRQLVFRTGKGGQTIVSTMPQFDPDRELSAAQKTHHRAFQQAAAYAKAARKQAIYIAKAEGTALNPYNVALKDWFHQPEIGALDVTGWDGGAGQPIRIQAIDDVQIARVEVVITDGHGTVFEQGAAEQSDASWWTYITRGQANGDRRVEVTAMDLPGNQAQTAWQNN